MAIGLVYQRANKDIYDLLTVAAEELMVTGGDIGATITNEIFPSMLNKIGDVIVRSDLVDRNYSRFKLPLSEFGAITEYLSSNMVKAGDAVSPTNGTVVNDFVIANPDIKAKYVKELVRASYALTINSDRWIDAIEKNNYETLASMMAVAFQSLYDGITHDHDAIIPALFGALYDASPTTAKRKIPKFTGNNIEEYSKKVHAVLNKAIRDLTQWRKGDFNVSGMDMSDTKDDLVLVSFENPVTTDGETSLDIITSQLNIGALARAKALGASLGVEVYEMPSPGIIEGSVERAYNIPNFPGMQSAEMKDATFTKPYPNIMYALVGKGAINVGLKRLQNDTSRSARGHFDQTWVTPTLQLSFGAGQAIFFEVDPEEPEEPEEPKINPES